MTDNPFRQLWDLGYTRLVPVIPPAAEVSERSQIAARMRAGEDPRGKVPGYKRDDGLWTGMQFVAMEAQERDLDVWHGMGASTGIKTGQGLIAIDIDTRDKEAARIIYELAAQRLGPSHVRFGQHPKCLMLYEAPQTTTYKRVTFSTGTEEKAAVELLSEGRQFVAVGHHPKTGKPYTWPHGVPRRDQITKVTTQQIGDFLDAVANALPKAKVHNSADERETPDQESLQATSYDQLKQVVEGIPNTSAEFPTREDYVRMAYAIKAAAPDGFEHEARDLYLDWCERWQDGQNDPDIALADWHRAKPPFRVGISYLQKHAVNLYFQPVQPDETTDMFAANAQATEQPKRKLEILFRNDIDSMVPHEYLIERHVPKGGLGFLYGAPGAGKSFIALDMALHLAYGKEQWHGDTIRSNAGWVIYLAREGSAGFKARIQAWENNRQLEDLNFNDCRFALIRETLNFMKPEDIKTLIEAVQDADLHPIDMIVVDTVSRVIPGADENLQKDMTLFVQACEALQQRFNCAVMGVHHAGKSGSMRGSTVFTGAGDFIFTLAKDEKQKHVVNLTCAKQKDVEDGWSEQYALETVALAGDKSSLVPRRRDAEEIKQSQASEDEQESMMQALQDAWDAGVPWTIVSQAKDRYGPRIMAQKFDCRADDALAYIDLWTQQGLVEMAAHPSNARLRGLRRRGPDVSGGIFS
jgi:RecA-family ATPase